MASSRSQKKMTKEEDFANYFCTYGFLYHQKDMLTDQHRMESYYDAILSNKDAFNGKIVLDVGTGTGVLALWAAHAGARKVYAVEMTDMAKQARRLVERNGFGDVVEVLQGSMEEVTLPEKVDIIISEWMGYFLLRESMLDSVIVARDRHLKEGGAMYPSHARMYLAGYATNDRSKRRQEYEDEVQQWGVFVDDTRDKYGIDFGCFSEDYRNEQEEYFLQTSLWVDVHPSQLLTKPYMFKEIDINTVTLQEIIEIEETFSLTVHEDGNDAMPYTVSGLVGWFDTSFEGSDASPVHNVVTLTTEPHEEGATHWGQQGLLLHPPITARGGDKIEGTIGFHRKADNHRLLNVKIDMKHNNSSGKPISDPQVKSFNIE